MADASSLVFTDVKGGMNSSEPPQSIAVNQVARMVNCRLEKGLPATRYGTRVVPLQGSVSDVVQAGNNQGSIFFNPAKGQGGIVLADDAAMLLVAVAGRKYAAKLTGRKESTIAMLEDLTGGHVTASQLHLVWWLGAEDLALANDAQSNCWIWDRSTGSRFSPGYKVATATSDERLTSSVPNGASVMAYSHTRIVAVVNARVILAGDNLHRTDSSTSKNLLDWIEQTYWATGQFFLPPTSVGNILAAENMATPGESNDGYAGLWFHLEDGIFALNLNVFPRSKWAETPMIKTALKVPGARGPYAVAILNGDQLFRSRGGLMSLKWAIGQGTTENPLRHMSEEVDCWLKNDYQRWLRFASLNVWTDERRVLMTTYPVVQGRWRWHRGIVVQNHLVTPTAGQPSPAWEGLWTFPPEISGIVQLVNGLFSEEERQFAWCRGIDGKNRLAEICPYLREDVKEDGTRVPIPCQVTTRAVDAGKWWESREYTHGRLFFRNIRGFLRWGVWVRSADSPEWIFWNGGTVESPMTAGPSRLTQSLPRPFFIPLGKLPTFACKSSGGGNAEARWVQCLIRWQGSATMENLRLTYGTKDITDDTVKPGLLRYTFAAGNSLAYDDFEYCSSEEPAWVTGLKANE